METQEKTVGVSLGGRLSFFKNNWLELTSDLRILSIIEGVTFEMTDLPLQKIVHREYTFDPSMKTKMDEEIREFEKKNIIERTVHENGQIISNIFPRIKKSGKVRIIGNFRDVNAEICYHKFKQTTIQAIVDMLRPNQFMVSIDLTDAYFCINVNPTDRKFLKFLWNGMLFQFTCLAQGIGCAPRLFTKAMKVPLSHLRENGVNIASYIDDIIIFADSANQCLEHCTTSILTLQKLGYVVNFEKSMLCPTQKIEHLGLVLDSVNMTVSLNDDKRSNIIKMCKNLLGADKHTIRTVAKLIGTMVSYLPGVEFGKLHYRQLEYDKIEALKKAKGNYECYMTLSKDAFNDIQWWIHNVRFQTNKIIKPAPTVVLSTDSSGTMWGAVRGTHKTGGCWDTAEQQEHINVLEIKAVLLGLQALCADCTDKHIRIRSDNTTTVHYINEMGGSRSYKCNLLAIQIWQWAIERQLWLSVEHVAGVLNQEADSESRDRNNSGEWALSQNVFENLSDIFKVTPTIDLFATRINFKINRFVSWFPDPQATLTDTFLHSFPNELFYAYPPINCVQRFLQKVELEQMEGIVVLPCWSTQPYFSALTKLLIDFPILIRWRPQVITHPQVEQHPLGKRLRLMACLISSKSSKIKAFRMQLLMSCVPDGQIVPINNITPILRNGTISVKKGTAIQLKVI